MPVEAGAKPKDLLVQDVVLSRIPAFPPVVLRALDLLSNDRAPIAALVREITSDATLSAQVLRIANSALFGFATPVDTVQHAVVALGMNRVQSLIMTVATSNYMRAALHTEAMAKCWRHSLAVAVLCQQLARAAGLPADQAYTVGLLHDIGRLGLLVAFPDAYNEILREADRDSLSLLDLEQRRFGMDHCEVGRILTAQWSLPAEFTVATGRHHDPPQGGPFDLPGIVHLSCALADSLGYCAVTPLHPMPFEQFQQMLPPAVRERMSETPDALNESIQSAIGEVGPSADACSDPPIAAAAPVDEAPAEPASVPATPIVWDLAIVLITVSLVALGVYFLAR